MRIIIIVSFLIFTGLIYSAMQVPTIDSKKIDEAIKDALADVQINEENQKIVENAVIRSVKILEEKQRKRLKFLASAYMIIWLVFMLYLIRLGKQQRILDQRLAQLEQDSEESAE